jgi:AcrR family transcriptional regulator
VNTQQEKRDNRHNAILSAAMQLAHEQSIDNLSRNEIAARAGVAAGSVHHAFITMDLLREAVVTEACRVEDWPLVLQAMTHPRYGALVDCQARTAALESLAPCT